MSSTKVIWCIYYKKFMDLQRKDFLKMFNVKNDREYYSQHLLLLNVLLPKNLTFSPLEIKYLSLLMSNDLRGNGMFVHPYSSLAKSTLNLSSASLSNMVRRLKASEWIRPMGKVSEMILPMLDDNQKYIFMIKINKGNGIENSEED